MKSLRMFCICIPYFSLPYKWRHEDTRICRFLSLDFAWLCIMSIMGENEKKKNGNYINQLSIPILIPVDFWINVRIYLYNVNGLDAIRNLLYYLLSPATKYVNTFFSIRCIPCSNYYCCNRRYQL